jgi:DNA-directed RNA polymerase specialized sigma24 family protein
LLTRVTDPSQHIEQVQDDAQQDDTLRNQIDAAQPMNEHLGQTVELVDAGNADDPEQKDEAIVAQQLTQGEPATARTHGLSARRTLKMTPERAARAQRMYDSGDYTVADIAESFNVSSTTIYRYLRTRRAT